VSPRRAPRADRPIELRIGEVAKLTGLTTRTLRYWEELGLLRPSGRRESGERFYAAVDMARVSRIRDLQELLGFSLAEVRAVLDTEQVDVLDRVRTELRSGDPLLPSRRRELLDEAIAANDHLLDRLGETQARIQAFRDERAATAIRLRATLDALDALDAAVASAPSDPSAPSAELAQNHASR
jgi:MerR family transcriptional regulator, repressor of the yfmOP operon